MNIIESNHIPDLIKFKGMNKNEDDLILTGSQEVVGSSPIFSTKRQNAVRRKFYSVFL